MRRNIFSYFGADELVLDFFFLSDPLTNLSLSLFFKYILSPLLLLFFFFFFP